MPAKHKAVMPDENLPAIQPRIDDDREIARQEIAASGGMWLPGQSGNPAGRPKGRKNHLTELKQELEIAVRDNLNPKVVRGILQRLAEMALAGNVKAAKIILDKVLTNASDAGEEQEQKGHFVFQVKNLTLKHDGNSATVSVERPIIDITPTTPQEPS